MRSSQKPWKRFTLAYHMSSLIVLGSVLFSQPGLALSELAQTRHNLTPSGPGPLHENAKSGLCVFCHTPHRAVATRALWNRDLPGITYTLYKSGTLKASPGQPTGSSRLCLSCHDGILALGSVHVPVPGSEFELGPLTGKTVLGTNLSDDHPVSLVYDSALATAQGELADPSTLPHETPLDDNQELQCNSCHDPHKEINPDFLRVDNRFGALCTTCHKPAMWDNSAHANSNAIWDGGGTNPWPSDAFPSVAENACLNCHRTHAATHPEWLLAHEDETENCTVCHNSTVASKDIASEFTKPFHHPTETGQWIHEPGEDPLSMSRHISCNDCHNPHSVALEPTDTTQTVSGSQQDVSGVTIAGVSIDKAVYKYEICLKCHGVQEPDTSGIFRVDSSRNIRLRIDPSNPSFHPVAAPGKNLSISGLNSEYTASSQIDCINCHDNDAWSAGGTQSRGPHGSNYAPILARQYITEDPVTESSDTYDLCYSCHDRAALLQPGSNGFPHATHVSEAQTSCAVCHDAHGSRDNTFLIDFMIRTQVGTDVVDESASGRLQFLPDPANPGHGTCYLSCHGSQHDPYSY